MCSNPKHAPCRDRLTSLDSPPGDLKSLLTSQEKQDLPLLRLSHFCGYEEDVGLRVAVEGLAGLGKASDGRYTQVYWEVRARPGKSLLCRSWT